jgi:hypothetical protein
VSFHHPNTCKGRDLGEASLVISMCIMRNVSEGINELSQERKIRSCAQNYGDGKLGRVNERADPNQKSANWLQDPHFKARAKIHKQLSCEQNATEVEKLAQRLKACVTDALSGC